MDKHRLCTTRSSRALTVYSMIVAALACSPAAATGPETDISALLLATCFLGTGGCSSGDGRTDMEWQISLEALNDSVGPFVNLELQGRRCWKVSCIGFNTILDSLNTRTDFGSPLKSCDVWIDSLSGQLLRVDIALIQDSADTLVEYMRSDLEFAARSAGETCVGLPETMPEVSLIEALSRGEHYAAYAHRIVAQYVMLSKAAVGQSAAPTKLIQEVFPAWVIYMPGIAATPTPGTGGPYRSGIRVVVDATTGKSFGLSTLHFPLTPTPR